MDRSGCLSVLRRGRLATFDDLGNSIDGLRYSPHVVSLPKGREELLVEHATGQGVGQDRLQPVAGLNPGFAILDGHQQHHAIVFALLADAPLPKQLIGEIVDLSAFQRRKRDQR